MSDPYNRLIPTLNAFEAMQERERKLQKLLEPTATERLLKQIDSLGHSQAVIDAAVGRPSTASAAIEAAIGRANLTDAAMNAALGRPSLTNAALEAAMGRHLQTNAAMDAARGFGAAVKLPDHDVLLGLTRTQAFLDVLERTSRGYDLVERHLALMVKFDNPLSQINRLSDLAAGRVPAWIELHDRLSWADRLADKMGTLNVDWALAGAVDASAEAFGRLARLADVANFAPVYVGETAELIEAELGTPIRSAAGEETAEEREERYDAAGRDRVLIAFNPQAYTPVLASAGFTEFPPPPPIEIVGGLVEPARFNPQISNVLQSLEAHLRLYIKRRLEAEEGAAWIKRRVPPKVREKWAEKVEAARQAGKPVYDPIHYSDFMDLFDIMVGNGNWNLFGQAFPSQEALKVTMLALYAVRNDAAHARPLTMSDELVVDVHATMLFRAIGLTVSRYS